MSWDKSPGCYFIRIKLLLHPNARANLMLPVCFCWNDIHPLWPVRVFELQILLRTLLHNKCNLWGLGASVICIAQSFVLHSHLYCTVICSAQSFVLHSHLYCTVIWKDPKTMASFCSCLPFRPLRRWTPSSNRMAAAGSMLFDFWESIPKSWRITTLQAFREHKV